MPLTISTPDSLRQGVEAATGGANTVVYDERGLPSVMVVLPRFNVEDVDPTLGAGVHPAFVVRGQVRSEILVGKFLSCVHDGVALSLPGQDPAGSLTADASITLCTAKGSGWHLLTNAEYAAIALRGWKRGAPIRGNTAHGAAHDARYETGRRSDNGAPGTVGPNARTLTGSGGPTWSHDGTPAGITDLIGNMWDRVAGVRLVDGELQIIPDNDASDRTVDQSSGSAAWRAVRPDGTLAAPGTADTLKFDSVNAGAPPAGSFASVGAAQWATAVANSNAPAGGGEGGYTKNEFRALAPKAGVTVPALLRTLSLSPLAAGIGTEMISLRNYGERRCLRGGSFLHGADAGLFAIDYTGSPTETFIGTGFRVAYLP